MNRINTEGPQRQLLKEAVARELREMILRGTIKPGEVIVEGKWGAHFGAAQGSVGEALHIWLPRIL